MKDPSFLGGALRGRFHVKAAADRGATREETLETMAIAIYMRAEPAAIHASHSLSACAQFAPKRMPHDLGRNDMFSRFGAGADPDVVDFGNLEEAVGTGAWTVIDVREPHEFAAGHIPNALNMPTSAFDPKELPKGKPVVLVCQAGGRSRNALMKARAAGRDDARHFPGGMNGWRSHNGPVSL
jgi:rhodanese-related sulfurtransferase